MPRIQFVPTLPTTLKGARERQDNMSRQALGEKLGISSSTISAWEAYCDPNDPRKATMVVSAEILVKYQAAMGLTRSEFIACLPPVSLMTPPDEVIAMAMVLEERSSDTATLKREIKKAQGEVRELKRQLAQAQAQATSTEEEEQPAPEPVAPAPKKRGRKPKQTKVVS